MKFLSFLKNKFVKSVLYLTLLLLLVQGFLYLFFVRNANLSITSIFQSYDTVNEDDFIECKVPKLNPLDPSIVQFIQHPKDFSCIQVQPNLTFIDLDGFLRFDEKQFALMKKYNDSFSCFYKTFDRCLGTNDSCIVYSEEMILKKPIKLSTDNVDVKCRRKDSAEFYHNIHAHPAENINRIFAKPTEEQFSVFLQIVDSTSFSALQRNMPLTYNYTKNVMGMKYFEAYNKVADNSFPNVLPMLTGKRVIDEQSDMMKEIDFDYDKIKYDTFPLIWKLFSGKGYATVDNEDTPNHDVFHYLTNGFSNKPVDFYYHTFWQAVNRANSENHSKYCFANVPRPQLLIDLNKRHLMVMKDKLQFVFSHLTEVVHNIANDLELFDDPFLQFFKQLYEGNYLNKTVIIFASDHGHRHSEFRSTMIGLLETHLPFYGVYFPPWFFQKYPLIEKNIDGNKHILSSNFDIYETLKDIFDANYEGNQRKFQSRGQSQLYSLQKNRTCKSSGIPDHFCSCVKESNLNLTDQLVKECAAIMVNHLNSLLFNVTDICSTIKLKNILYGYQVDFEDKMKKAVRNFDELKNYEELIQKVTANGKSKQKDGIGLLRIGIETEPFKARFEAFLRYDKTMWILSGPISRTNKYAGQSNCIKNAILEKYCACKIVL